MLFDSQSSGLGEDGGRPSRTSRLDLQLVRRSARELTVCCAVCRMINQTCGLISRELCNSMSVRCIYRVIVGGGFH